MIYDRCKGFLLIIFIIIISALSYNAIKNSIFVLFYNVQLFALIKITAHLMSPPQTEKQESHFVKDLFFFGLRKRYSIWSFQLEKCTSLSKLIFHSEIWCPELVGIKDLKCSQTSNNRQVNR